MIRKLTYLVLLIGILLEFGTLLFFLLPSRKSFVSKHTVSPTSVPTKKVISPTSSILELILVKGQLTKIPNSNITLLLQNTAQPNPKCPDCSSSTTIQASSSAGTKELIYSCGGLAGCILDQDFDTYVISIGKQPDQNSVTVTVKQHSP